MRVCECECEFECANESVRERMKGSEVERQCVIMRKRGNVRMSDINDDVLCNV